MSNQFRKLSRRTVIKGGMSGLLAAPFVSPSALAQNMTFSPSERITIGCLGVGQMGRGHLNRLLRNPEVQVVAISDVDQWRLNDAKEQTESAYAANTKTGTYKGCAAYPDFRNMLERPDIDAIMVASQDFWHPLHTIMAARAGKDVYVEKAISVTLHEARAMVDAVRRYGRVCQGGFQQRSTREFRLAVQLAHMGALGRVNVIYCNGIGVSQHVNLAAEPVPPTLNWDMWLGPAPYQPFNNRYHHLGKPRVVVPWLGNRDFGIGTMSSTASHNLDIAQWALGMDESGPVEIIPQLAAHTGRETLTYKYANGAMVKSFKSTLDPKEDLIPEGWDPKKAVETFSVLIVGERGWVYAARQGVIDAYPKDLLALVDAQPVPAPIQGSMPNTHHQNWIESIRTRQRPVTDIETAARSTSVAILGAMALWTNRTLKWDPVKEAFIGDEEANRMRRRPLREPWVL
ncbi:MAG: Gfo/Idh/MocA family protein [Candidatus Korobacteraceae bacterium]